MELIRYGLGGVFLLAGVLIVFAGYVRQIANYKNRNQQDRRWSSPAPFIGFPEPGIDNPDTLDLSVIPDNDTERLQIPEKAHPLVFGILHFPGRPRHIFPIPPIDTNDINCPLANRRAQTIHGRIPATQDNHPFALLVDIGVALTL